MTIDYKDRSQTKDVYKAVAEQVVEELYLLKKILLEEGNKNVN